jgi:hypothetical protein
VEPTPSYFKVSKSGRAVTFELSTSVECMTALGSVPTGAEISSKNLSSTGKALTLKIASGKFSPGGPIYGVLSVTGTARISGTFKSPTKLVATAQFSWPPSTIQPGFEPVPCESPMVRLTGGQE